VISEVAKKSEPDAGNFHALYRRKPVPMTAVDPGLRRESARVVAK
jgi:hypothetical protein